MITRRRVIYVHGYNPQGAKGYYGLFVGQLKRASALWQAESKPDELALESKDIASWSVDTSGGNWRVTTRYDFVRYEHVIRASMASPFPVQVARAVRWMAGDLVSGATRRIWRAAWRFQMHLFVIQMALLGWLALSSLAGIAAWYVAGEIGLHPVVGLVAAAAAAIAAFMAMRPLANRWFVMHINNSWPDLRALGRGEPTCFGNTVEAGARRLKAAVDANDADEILVVGHSAGSVLAPCIVARALELDPALGCKGPTLSLLTIGSIMPGVALHPDATWMREVIRRLAVEPGLQWIDCQARKDVMNFWNFDPVTGTGIDAGPRRCNPIFWRIRFHDLLSDEIYRRLNGNFFRLHYQFIMANTLRGPYDYFMLTCGPLPVIEWVTRGNGAVAEFAADGSLVRPRPRSAFPPSAAAY